MSRTVFRAVLFDFDGTLVDTIPVILDCLEQSWREVMADADVPAGAEFLSLVGKPLETMMVELVTPRWQPCMPAIAELTDKLVSAYRRRYETVSLEARAFPGTTKLLEDLGAMEVRRGIVTNKIRRTTLRQLQHLGLRSEFDVVVTVEDVTCPKPHAEPLQVAAEQLGVKLEETVYVGDTVADVMAARNAGVGCVAIVSWGVAGRLYRLAHGDEPCDPAQLTEPAADMLLKEWDSLIRLIHSGFGTTPGLDTYCR
ncbi:MAG: HAD family hydrolase [Limnochordales bacterium]|nr:HAD family hydrolase [Limnochordales bacterium]